MKDAIKAICVIAGAAVAACGMLFLALVSSVWFWVVVIAITLMTKL